MQVGNLIRIKHIPGVLEKPGYLLHVTEILPTGINVMILEGKYFGAEHFLPFGGKEWEILG